MRRRIAALVALPLLALAGCSDGASEGAEMRAPVEMPAAFPSDSYDESEVVEYLGLEPHSSADDYWIYEPGGLACEISDVMVSPADVEMQGPPNVYATNPQQSVGVVIVAALSERECHAAITEALSGF